MAISPPVFIDLSLEDQALELKGYFKNLGAPIDDERSPKGIEDDLHQVISVCDYSFEDTNESDVESVLNAVVSMLVMIPPQNAEKLVITFSGKLAKAPAQKFGQIAQRVLWLLFQTLKEDCTIRYSVYYDLILVGKQVDKVTSVFRDVTHLKKQFSACPPSTEQMQKLLRLLHEALLSSRESEQAAKVMIELLGTYTTSNASDARDDAHRCILSAVADPDTFLLDPLLSLKPISVLKGERVHDLLLIFVSGKLSDYLEFYEKNKDFISEQGLNHEHNMTKMRLLTFMQLAEGSSEINFTTITQELQINENEVEEFIIDVLKTKLVRARMDEAMRKVYIASTMHRTFGRSQWLQLRDTLLSWKNNLSNVQQGMASVAKVQMDLVSTQ